MPPIEEELGFDISDALAALDRIDDRFQQIVSGLSTGLAEAIGVLDVSAVDAGPLTDQLDAAIAAVDTDQLGADIEAGVPDDLSVAVDGDAGAVEEAIDSAVAGANTDVAIVADASDVISAIEESIEAADTEIAVTVSSDTQGLADFADVSTSASAAADLATGSAAGLGAALGGISPGAAAAVGGVGALGAAAGLFVTKAIEAESATASFVARTGEFGDSIRNLNVAGLSGDLSDLAVSLGSDDEAALGAAASIFQFGVSSGAAGGQVAEITQEVIALASRAVALNPALGDVGSVAEGLGRALQRGGRALVPFGLDLQSAEIQAHALELGLGGVTGELTGFDKLTAAADLAMRRFGDTIEGDVADGTKNAGIRLRAFRQEFDNALESLGQPLIVPFFDLLDEAIHVAVEFGTVIADLATVILPPLADAIGLVADILTAIPTPVIQATLVFLALQKALKLAETAYLAIATAPALGASITAALGPIGLAAAGIGVLAFAISQMAGEVEDSGPDLDALAGKLFTIDQAARGGSGGLKGLQADIRAIVEGGGDELGQIGELLTDDNRALLNQLAELGISYRTLTGLVVEYGNVGSRAGQSISEALLLDPQIAGQVQGLIDDFNEGFGFREAQGFDVSQPIANVEELVALVESGRIDIDRFFNVLRNPQTRSGDAQLKETVETALDLGGAFNQAASGVQQFARDSLISLRGQELLTAAEEDAISTTDDFVSLLFDAESRIAATGAATDDYTNSLTGLLGATETLPEFLGSASSAFGGLGQAIIDGRLNVEDFGGAAALLRTSAEQVEAFATRLTSAVQGFVDTAVGALPNAADAFAGVDDELSVEAVRTKLQQIAADTLIFTANLQTIASGGFEQTVQVLASLGPEAAGRIASSLVAGGRAGLEAFEADLRNTARSRDIGARAIEELAPGIILKSEEIALEGSRIFGQNLNFDTETAGALDLAESVLLANQEVRISAGLAGADVGENFGDGIASGIRASEDNVDRAVRGLVDSAEEQAKIRAGISSPSRLFMRIGDELVAGLILPFEDLDFRPALSRAFRAATPALNIGASAAPVVVRVEGGGDSTTTTDSGTHYNVSGPLLAATIEHPTEPVHLARELGYVLGEP